MFKQAADKTASQSARFSASQNARSSNLNSFVMTTPAKPLNTVSGNASKRPVSSIQQHGLSRSLKRSRSGLARALQASDGFEESLYPVVTSHGAKKPKHSNQTYLDGVYLDENDFADDFDLESESINMSKSKDVVTYPDLSGLVDRESDILVSKLASDDLLPWSSSPADHFTSLNAQAAAQTSLKSYRYTGPTPLPAKLEPKVTAAKVGRRKLPWAEKIE